MKKLIHPLLTVVAIFLLSGVALSDTLYLRDGRSFRGTLIGYINGRFAFKVIETRTQAPTQPTPQPAAQTTPQTNAVARGEGEIQFFDPSEVDRVELDGRSLDELKFE